MKYIFTITCCLLITGIAYAQDYVAEQGSSFAGSLGVADNPSSIVNTPFAWDITLFSIQAKNTTNAVTIKNYSLLSSASRSQYFYTGGNYSRYGHINFNSHLLNLRVALSRTSSIAVGMNIRGYGDLKTSPYNFIDTLHGVREFFNMNQPSTILEGNFISSSWVEIFATYARTIFDHGSGRFNAGITFKVSRGISGATATIQNGRFEPVAQNRQTVYRITEGAAQYGYSSNYDLWQSSNNTGTNLNNFLFQTEGGAALDAGFEYLAKTQAVSTVYDEDDYFDYDWKIGLSVVDIGFNQYKFGKNSRVAGNPVTSLFDSLADQKFYMVSGFQSFNDSVHTIANSFVPLSGKFKVLNPVRLLLNVDKNLYNHFYINGALTLDMAKWIAGKRLYVQSNNLITITPRWENRFWGVYLPVKYNVEGNLWIGGAFKAGPLLIGVHNWANIFSKNKMNKGGGYIAIVLHAKNNTQKKKDKRLNCPAF